MNTVVLNRTKGNNSLKVSFPAKPSRGTKETFIMTCLSAFRTLKYQGEEYLQPNEMFTIDFLKQYKNLTYAEFKRQALSELMK